MLTYIYIYIYIYRLTCIYAHIQNIYIYTHTYSEYIYIYIYIYTTYINMSKYLASCGVCSSVPAARSLIALASSRRMLAYADVCCSMLTHADVCADVCSRMHAERSLLALASCRAYVSIRQHASAYVSACTLNAACSHSPPAEHTSVYVSIRQHTSAHARCAQPARTHLLDAVQLLISFCTLVLVKLVKWGVPRAACAHRSLIMQLLRTFVFF